MQKLSQKYTIIQLLEDRKEGSEFSSDQWPLHVTIADVFAVNWNNNLLENLSELLAKLKPIMVTAGHDEYFGPEQQVQVTILNMGKNLPALHCSVIKLLKNAGAEFNEPQYIEKGFRAHATVQLHSRLLEGELVNFNSLSIVDMFPDNDPYRRRIIKTINLQGQ